MQPMVLTIGLSTAFTTPKISATTTSVPTLDAVLPAVSWMPESMSVATNSATAVISTRISAFMPSSWHAPAARHPSPRPPVQLLPPEVDEQAAEVLGVLLHAVVERLDLLLVEEAEYPLLELPGALARDDLDQRRLLPHRLVDDVPQRTVDVLTAVIDVMQVELELHLAGLR